MAHATGPETGPDHGPESGRATGRVGGFRAFYGEHPLHLLVLAASLALTAYAVSFLVQAPNTLRVAIWFLAAVVAHDLVLFPLYALADRSLTSLAGWRARRRTSFAVPAVNHVRLPVLASGLLLLIFFPTILRQGAATYLRASGVDDGSTYLARWLLLTGAFFLVSAVVYAVRVARSRSGAGPAA